MIAGRVGVFVCIVLVVSAIRSGFVRREAWLCSLLVSDDDKPTDDLRAKAAFAVAKHAVERALDDAMLSDEERTKRRAEEDALAKSKRTKRIAQIVIGGLLLIGLIGLLLNYWYWALLLGLVGAAGWYVRRRWRARRTSKKVEPKKVAPKKVEPAAIREAPARKVRVEPKPAPVAEPSDESIDDDLAELKARMKR
jgi:hypothetical protein